MMHCGGKGCFAFHGSVACVLSVMVCPPGFFGRL